MKSQSRITKGIFIETLHLPSVSAAYRACSREAPLGLLTGGNSWNSEIATSNIQKAVKKLGVELHTVVADWVEFKDLQLAFLKAFVPDAEIPTDYAIYSVLFNTAVKEKIRYIFEGHSFRAEAYCA